VVKLNNQKIKVMRIIARMNIGGPAIQISGLYRNLDPEFFEHLLYTGYCAPDEVDYLESRATDVKANRVPGLGRKIDFLSDFKAFLYLRKEIKNQKPDIIHTHTAKAGLIGRIAYLSVTHKAKVVHTFHGHILTGYYGKTLTKAIVLMERLLGLCTSKIFSVGQVVLDDLVKEGVAPKSKFILMPPGLELGPLVPKHEARAKFGLDVEGLMCGYIVRVTRVKRPDRFLDVVRNCRNSGTKLKFIVAGDGDLLSEIKEIAASENLPIVFLGMVPEIELVFSAVDMVVMTSDNEGMPLTLIQAGLAGLPSVTTDVGSSRHVVINGVSGFVTKTLDSREIAECLDTLVCQPDVRALMGEAGRKHCANSFGVSRLAQDHKREYLDLLS